MSKEDKKNQQQQVDPVGAILSIMAKRGGLDLSNALSDPFLAFLAGTYQGQPQKSEGDIYAEFAPTLMSIQANEPDGSWRKVAASQIASGIPAYRVKENILALAQEDPSVTGLLTSKEAAAFVDELAAENQKAQNELTKQAEQLDPFQKAGLPGARQVYTAEDVVNMNPETFRAIVQQEVPQELKAKMKALEEYAKKPIYREQKPMGEALKGLEQEQGGLRAALYGGRASNKMELPASEVYFDPSQDTATTLGQAFEKADLYGGKNYLGGLIQEKPLSALLGLYKGLTDIPGSVIEDIIRPGKREKDILEREAKKRTKVDAEGEPVKVLNRSAMKFREESAQRAKDLFSRMKGGEEYNQRVAAAMAERLAQRMAEQGRTPLSDALLRTAIVSRQLRK
jgi:hypothetical protein